MKKSVVFMISAAFLLLVGMIAVLSTGINRRSYELHLPVPEKLSGISVEKGSGQAEITGREEIEGLIDVLNGSGRSTKEESISDAEYYAVGKYAG